MEAVSQLNDKDRADLVAVFEDLLMVIDIAGDTLDMCSPVEPMTLPRLIQVTQAVKQRKEMLMKILKLDETSLMALYLEKATASGQA